MELPSGTRSRPWARRASSSSSPGTAGRQANIRFGDRRYRTAGAALFTLSRRQPALGDQQGGCRRRQYRRGCGDEPACSTTPRPATGKAMGCSTSRPEYSGAPGASTRDSCPIRQRSMVSCRASGGTGCAGNRRIWNSRRGMEIDFGGIVKEYAVDRVAALCCERGRASWRHQSRWRHQDHRPAPGRVSLAHRHTASTPQGSRHRVDPAAQGQRGEQRRLRALHPRRRRSLRARAESEDRLAGAASRLGERRR